VADSTKLGSNTCGTYILQKPTQLVRWKQGYRFRNGEFTAHDTEYIYTLSIKLINRFFGKTQKNGVLGLFFRFNCLNTHYRADSGTCIRFELWAFTNQI